MREAVILAGGLGTRLRSAVPNIPKVLAPVAGRPFLSHVFSLLEKGGFERAILAVGHRRGDVMAAFGERAGKLKLEYSIEEQPLGTGGAIWLAARRLTAGQNFFAFNGDTYAAVDIEALEKAMIDRQADIAMAVYQLNDTQRYGRVETNDEGLVTGFREKEPKQSGLINAGVYLMRHDLLSRFSFANAFSLETDLLQKHCGALRIAAVPMDGYFIDIGVPEDYDRANRELA